MKVCAIYVRATFELEKDPTPVAQKLINLFERRGLPVIDLTDSLPADMTAYYRDVRHINAEGQSILAKVLRACDEAATRAN